MTPAMKGILFRLGAAGLGLAVVICLEWSLRLTHTSAPTTGEDPFVGFSGVHPLFVVNEVGDRFETATSRTNYFVREQFPVHKEERAFRAFFLGGSTVQGRPYAIETAFPQWLELLLGVADPDRTWRMVNCGGISYASYRLVLVLKEVLERYEPDLIVLCTGQNEFLEDVTYQHIKGRSPRMQAVLEPFESWHLVHLMRQGLGGLGLRPDREEENQLMGSRSILPSEVDAFLDYQNGLESYHWNPEWRLGVRHHFEHNVNRMVQMCRAASVPVVLLSPPVNLRSSPPFKSEHRADLSPPELDEWQRLVERARLQYATAPRDAIKLLQQATTIDPQYADTQFALGTILEHAGRRREARKAFVAAKELDVCPLRILDSERRSLQQTAERYEVPFIDLHHLLEAQSDYLTLGSELLVDHIHPTIVGHQQIGLELLELFKNQRWVPRDSELSGALVKATFEQHMKSLGPSYFVHGKQRLDNLMLWTQGRTDGLPIELKPETQRE